VAVARPAEAQVVIVSDSVDEIANGCPPDPTPGIRTVACAQIGFAPGSRARVVLPDALGPGSAPTVLELRLVEHELGHVLGSGHLPGCAVMNPNPALVDCGLPAPEHGVPRALCGPFAADVRQVAKLYGVPVPAHVYPVCTLPSTL
jgi:hypothetical protein